MADLDWPIVLLFLTGLLAVLLLKGLWIPFALTAAACIYLVLSDGPEALRSLGSIGFNTVNSFVLTAVPLFLLMGEVIVRSGISIKLYRGASVLLHRAPGGLLHANIVASGVLAAMSGSSVAASAAMASVAIPEMDRAGYDRRLAFSSLAGGGSVGQLIPPSLGALIYGSYAELSISRLFIAGLVPGLLLLLMFSAYIAFRVWRQPALAPPLAGMRDLGWRRKASVLMATTPAWLLVLLVLGSIYLGIATPTEAAALGALGAVFLGRLFGDLTWSRFAKSAMVSATLSASLLFIVVGAQILSAALVQADITRGLTGLVELLDPSPFVFYLFLVVLYVVLDAFMDGISLILVTLPVLLPVIATVGMDPYIFGVLLVLFVELGQITPPIGVDLFIIKGVATDASISDIFRGALPICGIILLMTLLIFVFPEIALWLPDQTKAMSR